MNANRFDAFLIRLSRGMAWLAGASLVGMVAVVVVDVAGRRLLPGFSINGAIELAVVCVVLLGYFGLPWAYARNTHITVEIATTSVSERVRNRLDAFWSLVGALVAAFLCWQVLQAGIDLNATGQVSEILRMSPLVTYVPAAFGLAVTVVVAVNGAIRTFRAGRG